MSYTKTNVALATSANFLYGHLSTSALATAKAALMVIAILALRFSKGLKESGL